MRFNTKNCDSDSKIYEITKTVAKTFMESLNNKAIFDFKMKRLMVRPFDVPVKHPFAETLSNQKCNELVIIYDESMSSRFLAFIVAHEMAHILFHHVGDVLVFQRKKIRYIQEGKDCFIENKFLELETEEAMADYVALYIISKLEYDDEGGMLEEFLQDGRAQRMQKISQLEIKSGKPLRDCKKIDEFDVKDDEVVIANSFWYNAVTHFLR